MGLGSHQGSVVEGQEKAELWGESLRGSLTLQVSTIEGTRAPIGPYKSRNLEG